MIKQKAEYINLAKKISEMKSALGMAPGAETDVVLNSAEAGLYDNENVGRTGGAFASRARAIMDGDGADAAEIAAQENASKNKARTGTVIGGVGVVGGAIGNLIINAKAGASGAVNVAD